MKLQNCSLYEPPQMNINIRSSGFENVFKMIGFVFRYLMHCWPIWKMVEICFRLHAVHDALQNIPHHGTIYCVQGLLYLFLGSSGGVTWLSNLCTVIFPGKKISLAWKMAHQNVHGFVVCCLIAIGEVHDPNLSTRQTGHNIDVLFTSFETKNPVQRTFESCAKNFRMELRGRCSRKARARRIWPSELKFE